MNVLKTAQRELAWEGSYNARDLGGIQTRDGKVIRRGAVVRSDSLDGLTPDAWRAVEEHGVRTIIDLRNDDERSGDVTDRPSTIDVVTLPIDNIHDDEFWAPWRGGWQFGTPLFYAPHVKRFPTATASVITAIANARDGGVVVHCAAGRDRTGLVTMLLLMLLEVEEDAILADYLASREQLRRLFVEREEPDAGERIDRYLSGRGTTLEEVFTGALRAVDRPAWLREGSITESVLTRLRARLLEG